MAEGGFDELLRDERLGLKGALCHVLHTVTGGQDPASFFGALARSSKCKESVCSAVWRRGTLAYRCLECEVDRNSAICPDCFRSGPHASALMNSSNDAKLQRASSGVKPPSARGASGWFASGVS